MKLSENFLLSEFVKSQTAERKGINNVPGQQHINNLKLLCMNILQPVRDHFGSFTPSSGYRCPELCVAIGSKETSQHAKGQAADFEVFGKDNKEVANWIIDNLEYDQLILECYKEGEANSGWIHVSYICDAIYHDTNRNQKLIYQVNKGYTKVAERF